MKTYVILLTFLVAVFSSTLVHAEEDKLSVPRFVSLGSGKANARTGPGKRYPVRWTYVRDGLPVEIVGEFDVWRKVRDKDGEEGWVHKSLLSVDRTVIISTCSDGSGIVPLFRDASSESVVVAKAEKGAILDLETCVNAWCQASFGGFDGWIERKFLWGIYPNENFN